jgi:iron complex outermembrane receptor protein
VSSVDFLPKASIDYHFSKDIMAYFTVSRGDEEGDLTDNSFTDPSLVTNPNQVGSDEVVPYKTEFALSYELGFKSTLFDRRLTFNAAAFYIDYTNRIFEVGKFIGTGLFTFEENVGASANYGLELETQAHPTRELTFTGGLGLIRTDFGHATLLDGSGNPLETNGHEGPDTPNYEGTLGADWRHHIADDLVVNARIDARFTGRSFWSAAGCNALSTGCPSQGADSIQRPYQIVNGGLALDYGKHWSVSAHVSNIFDTRYNTFFANLSETGSPFNVAGISRPREWSISVTARY